MHLFGWLDIRTLAACQVPMAAVFAIALFALRKVYPHLKGIGLLALGFLLWVPATSLLVAQSILLPGPAVSTAIVVGDLLAIGCYVILYRGVLSFFESKGVLPLLYDVASVAAAVIIYFTVVYDLSAPRVVALSLVVALSRALIAIELLCRAKARAIILLFAGFVAVFAVLPLGLTLVSLLHGVAEPGVSGILGRGAVTSLNVLLDLFFLGGSGVFTLCMFLEEGHRDTEQSGQFDHVTGTLNRRAIEELLTVEIARSSRTHSPISVMMIEVDHFSTLAAIHGHAKTDEVLCTVVSTIGSILRFYDKCGRLAEDKFLVLLPENVAEHAMSIAARFREALKHPSLPHDQPVITLSVGITQSAFKELTADVLARAETALVEARRNGRDCACLGYENHPKLQSVPSGAMNRLNTRSRIAAKLTR